jgi:hypothetical protein
VVRPGLFRLRRLDGSLGDYWAPSESCAWLRAELPLQGLSWPLAWEAGLDGLGLVREHCVHKLRRDPAAVVPSWGGGLALTCRKLMQ